MASDDPGKLVEITYVDRLEFRQEWEPAPDRFMGLPVYADLAQTTHITLRGRSTDRWYRRYPHPFDGDQHLVWRSVGGGSVAPECIVRALSAAEQLQS